MMNTKKMLGLKTLISASIIALTGTAHAHGDVQPQAVDTTGLPQLCDEWVDRNPYVGNKRAIEIGASAYNQNCARCHGLDAKSGGIAPDLRMLPHDADGDEWFQYRMREGATRNGITYMPKFADTDGGPLSQEALWAIRAWLQTVAVDGAEVVQAKSDAHETTEKACLAVSESKTEANTDDVAASLSNTGQEKTVEAQAEPVIEPAESVKEEVKEDMVEATLPEKAESSNKEKPCSKAG